MAEKLYTQKEYDYARQLCYKLGKQDGSREVREKLIDLLQLKDLFQAKAE